MAEIVRQADVLKHIIAMLTAEFKCKVYADEVREDFRKPCFFIAATSVMTPKTMIRIARLCAAGKKDAAGGKTRLRLVYYPKDAEKNEITYMDVVDRVQMLFPVGIQTSDRFLKIESIEDDRVGEEDDILAMTIVIPYIERTNGSQGSGDMMEEVNMNVIDSKENKFPDTITKEETGG